MTKPAREFKNFGKLPGRPSELIRLALKDLLEIEKDPNYEIDMDTWHSKIGNFPCAVCFAGVVMSQSLGAPISRTMVPGFFNKEQSALEALDFLRRGNVLGAFQRLLVVNCDEDTLEIFDETDLNKTYSVADYHLDSSQFKSDMRKLAETLEREGF